MLIGRICLSLIFVTSSITKLFTWDGAVHYMTTGLNHWLTATQFPDFMHQGVVYVTTHAVLLLIIATLFEGVGGLFVLLGFKVRMGATLLILFLAPVTLVMHSFWLLTGAERELQMIMFMKNLAILGGLFILAAKAGESEG
jgi:putative oxidoreductase